jgi:hypothetical protein
VEVYNPLPVAHPLDGYKLGDAEERGKCGEAMLAFPAGARLGPGATLVVALDASAFFADYGIYPDYE